MPLTPAEGTRRLVTVLTADAVGFSRRMGANESAAVVATLQCRTLFGEIVGRFGGRLVGTPGDFVLAVMGSSLEALDAAIEIQVRLAERNLLVDPALRAEYRIGIGLGDVYEHDNDILGDAVNVAARLQAIAPPGGVVISGAVRDIVGASERLAFQYLGDQALKNLLTPVRAYLVARHPRTETVEDYGAFPSLRNAERPPIKPVVEIEPFRPSTGNEEETLFAECMTEELVTLLAGLANSLVIRHHDSKQTMPGGGGQDAPRLYRLGGRVHRAMGEVRISAQLFAQGTGEVVWADRFRYRSDDVFDAQEVIAREVITAIQIKLTEGDQAQLWRRGTASVRAWELFQRGHDRERSFTRHGHVQAREFYRAALDLDPAYVNAIVALAFCHLDEIRLGWTEDADRSFAEAETLYWRAVAIDPDCPDCHALLAYIELRRRNDERAVAAMEKAVTMAPRSAELAAYLGYVYETVGRYQDAIAAYDRAMGLSAHFPSWIATNLGFVLCIAGRLHDARRTFLGVTANDPAYVRAHLGQAIAYRRLGLMEDALRASREVTRLDPLFSVEAWMLDRPYADPVINQGLAEDMRSLGLP